MAEEILANHAKTKRENLSWMKTGMKSCHRCCLTKPVDAFHKINRGNSIASYCKSCESERARAKKPRKTPVRFESDTHRECRSCGLVKEKSHDFYRMIRGSGVGGYSIYCRPCQLSKTKSSRKDGYWRGQAERAKSDPRQRLKLRTLNLVRKSLCGRIRYKRTGSVTSEFWISVGYTQDQLFQHIERQFMKGMSWQNMSMWHIDHIIPDSSFSYHSMGCDGFKQSWALSNLRPLWAREDEGKGASILYLL